MKKYLIMGLLATLLLPEHTKAAAEVYAAVGVTYGGYSGSVERDYLLTERLNLSFYPEQSAGLTSGLTLHLENVDLVKNAGFADLDQYQVGVSGYQAFQLEKGAGYLGGRLDLQYLDSDDQFSDSTLIPYGAVTFKSADGRYYLDAGYAFSNYDRPDIDQYTVTVGLSLAGGRAWSQTRLYYINPDTAIQGEDETLAVEERLSYYAVPQKLTLGLYFLLGKRIFAYDPDILTVYNLTDVQKGSVGLSSTYQFSENLSLLGDVTYEAYQNNDLQDKYSVIYGTINLTYRF